MRLTLLIQAKKSGDIAACACLSLFGVVGLGRKRILKVGILMLSSTCFICIIELEGLVSSRMLVSLLCIFSYRELINKLCCHLLVLSHTRDLLSARLNLAIESTK